MTAPHDFDFEIKNLEEVVATAQRKTDSAKEELNQAQINLARLRTEKQKAFEKTHSGTRVAPVPGSDVYVIARGHYLDNKYFSFYVDGRPCWVSHPAWSMKFESKTEAEQTVKEILESERETRAERKQKKLATPSTPSA